MGQHSKCMLFAQAPEIANYNHALMMVGIERNVWNRCRFPKIDRISYDINTWVERSAGNFMVLRNLFQLQWSVDQVLSVKSVGVCALSQLHNRKYLDRATNAQLQWESLTLEQACGLRHNLANRLAIGRTRISYPANKWNRYRKVMVWKLLFMVVFIASIQ